MRKKGLFIALLAAIVLCFAGAVCNAALSSSNQKSAFVSDYHMTVLTEGWECAGPEDSTPAEPGTETPVSGGRFLLSREIFPEELGENVMLFNNERQSVTVRADGEVLFQVGVGERSFQFFATSYCAVSLPEKGHSYRLELEFTGLEDGVCSIPEFFFGSLNDIVIFLCLNDIVTIASIPLLVMLGIALAVLSVFLISRRIFEPRVICLSVFLLMAATWSIFDMELLCLTGLDMEVISTVSHLLLAAMPLPILYFIRSSCSHRRLLLGAVFHGMLLINFFAQVILFQLNVVSLHDMLMFSQGLLVCMLIYGAAAAALDYRAEKTITGKALAVAFLVSALMGCMTVFFYWISDGDTKLYHAFFQTSLYFFMVAMLAVLMISIEQYSTGLRIKDAELSAYRAISELDQLTGIRNRRPFDALMQQIEADANGSSNPTLVFMDLNGLKYTNDKFGHLAGDELIIAAARCIGRGFEGAGRTFRVGGDEFAAVITDPTVKLADCFQKMDEAIEQYNRTAYVPLSIARGSCSLLNAGGHRLSVSDWKMNADKNMYRDKVVNRIGSTTGSTRDYLEIISSFVSAVDAKDSYTANHSSRVGVLSDHICRMLGLSQSSTEQIHIAACLHDIGKIGIPDAILLKADKLTDTERAIMQNHSITGEEILKQTRAFYDVSQIIRHHHERFDGRGYPDGLSGTEIPLGARIIAIADSIDAMTSNRSYRRALSIADCREEVRKNLDKMYDPAIGSIVLENWNEIEKIILSQPSE